MLFKVNIPNQIAQDFAAAQPLIDEGLPTEHPYGVADLRLHLVTLLKQEIRNGLFKGIETTFRNKTDAEHGIDVGGIEEEE